MPLCSRVVSKPGYSTFAEALRQKTPIVSLTREGFGEATVLLEGIQNHSQHLILNPEDFFETDWDFLQQPLQPPRQPTSLPTNGTETIAQAIIEYYRTSA